MQTKKDKTHKEWKLQDSNSNWYNIILIFSKILHPWKPIVNLHTYHRRLPDQGYVAGLEQFLSWNSKCIIQRKSSWQANLTLNPAQNLQWLNDGTFVKGDSPLCSMKSLTVNSLRSQNSSKQQICILTAMHVPMRAAMRHGGFCRVAPACMQHLGPNVYKGLGDC